MADIAITAANFIPSTNATLAYQTAGAAIAAGEVVCQDTDGTIKLADANGATPTFKVFGIAANSAAVGQPVTVIARDPSLTLGNVALGSAVILSATPGKIAPTGDAATGMYVTVLGVGIGSNKLNFNPIAAGAAIV